MNNLFWLSASFTLFAAPGQCATFLPTWSWDKVALWSDFSVGPSLLDDYQSEFVATHYQLISLEKCIGDPRTTPTEVSFYKTAQDIRRYSGQNQTAIVFYWAIDCCFCDCYNITQEMLNNQSMWLKDDYGNYVLPHGDQRPMYDHTQQFVREWWVDSLVTILINAFEQGIVVNGVFADGACPYLYGMTKGNISMARSNEYKAAVAVLLNMTRTAFKTRLTKYSDDVFVAANGLISYSFVTDNCMSIVPSVDGVLIEHFGAFEEVQDKKGTINATDLLIWIELTKQIMETYDHQKFVLVKSWIGPETTPINHMGPSWPVDYYMKTPTTHLEIANAAAMLLDFPLAVYLCGMATEGVYLNYAWWYQLHQGYVPCPDDPNSCDCPVDFYPQFSNRLGAPKSDGIMNGFQCEREFEYVYVKVDLTDASSAVIEWK